ncbi:MAG: RloB domain-containing protein [Saprospiraceae bacterium]|nr:RloB domain-containing protein [Saprospiraceae bacterium]
MEKIRKPRLFDRNMLIVCEDSHTAPNYLLGLKRLALAQNSWDYIEILPKPPLEMSENTEGGEALDVGVRNEQDRHKTNRSQRQFMNMAQEEWLEFELEKEFREQPVRYVRTAQQALADGSYAEGWAVYDLDGHTGHRRAAAMAKETPEVKIAFSSRAIEMWFLLHFGVFDVAFQKVHCKGEKKKVLNCNAQNFCRSDGRGDCLTGFMRRNTPLWAYKKSEDYFPILNPLLENAMRNARFLREKYPENLPFFERNPYTTMDFLIKSLLKWVGQGEETTIGFFKIKIVETQPDFVLVCRNISEFNQILHESHFFSDGISFRLVGDGVFEPDEQRFVTLKFHSQTTDIKFKFPAENDRDFVWFLSV